MTTQQGKLTVKKQKLTLEYQNSNKKIIKSGIGFKVLSKQLYEQFQTSPDTLNSLDVEFDLNENNACINVRQVGVPFEAPVIQAAPVSSPTTPSVSKPKTVDPDYFHNPYNFVPALPRIGGLGGLGDAKPIGHGCYHEERYSGRIAVKLTTITPLIIPDASLEEKDTNNHKTYPVRLGTDGKPYLPPTSIKGMLRSAYEAVTNSRLAVFEDHDARLAYRMPARIGLQMVPARIENNQIHLYPGTSQIGNDGRPRNGDPMYAAWLPRYNGHNGKIAQFAVRYPDNSLPQHKDHVEFWAEKFAKVKPNGNQIFTYWRVRKIVKQGQQLGNKPEVTPAKSGDRHRSLKQIEKFKGYVYITNKNIDGKHDERVFIVNDQVTKLRLTDELKKKWKELITNYQEIHEDEINKKPPMKGPPALNHSVWSRQVTGNKTERELQNGTLCYAHVKNNGGQYEVLNLYPVMITRGFYEMSPLELLDPSLRPATDKDKLSPADRVFGWVNQKGNGSYKGHLRVHSVSCLSDNPIDNFGNDNATVPLTILGQPKPEQARFYCAGDRNGRPLNSNVSTGGGYANNNQSLRGRKVYPHHKGLPENYWQNPTQDRTQQAVNGHYQEYRRPKKDGQEQKDDQNRSLKGWVKPGVEFQFEIDITNLSPVELGALLWLLSLPNGHYHRLGGAKPLGFGSVHLAIDWDNTDLRKGSDLKAYYQSLSSLAKPEFDREACTSAYKDEVKNAYSSSSFEQVKFISAFCRSAKGFDDNATIHYPRITPNPTAEGEAFKWFVENEQDSRDEIGLKQPLTDLSDTRPTSFPIHPKRPNPNNQQNRRR